MIIKNDCHRSSIHFCSCGCYFWRVQAGFSAYKSCYTIVLGETQNIPSNGCVWWTTGERTHYVGSRRETLRWTEKIWSESDGKKSQTKCGNHLKKMLLWEVCSSSCLTCYCSFSVSLLVIISLLKKSFFRPKKAVKHWFSWMTLHTVQTLNRNLHQKVICFGQQDASGEASWSSCGASAPSSPFAFIISSLAFAFNKASNVPPRKNVPKVSRTHPK